MPTDEQLDTHKELIRLGVLTEKESVYLLELFDASQEAFELWKQTHFNEPNYEEVYEKWKAASALHSREHKRIFEPKDGRIPF